MERQAIARERQRDGNRPAPQGTRQRPALSGFTLLELMVTLAVAAIVVTIAVPNFRSVVQSNNSAALTNDIVGALNYARSEAVRRGRPVSVCASVDQQQCSSGTGETDWAPGWIVFTDEGTAGVRDGTDAVLRIWQAPRGRPDMTADRPFVRYLGSGLAEAGLIVDARLPDGACYSDRTIRVSRGGRPNVERSTCS